MMIKCIEEKTGKLLAGFDCEDAEKLIPLTESALVLIFAHEEKENSECIWVIPKKYEKEYVEQLGWVESRPTLFGIKVKWVSEKEKQDA